MPQPPEQPPTVDGLVRRLRKPYRSLDGVVVVSPRLLAEAAETIERLTEENNTYRDGQPAVTEPGATTS